MPTDKAALLTEAEIKIMAQQAFDTFLGLHPDEGAEVEVEDLYLWGACVAPAVGIRNVYKSWELNEMQFRLALNKLIKLHLRLVPQAGLGKIRLLLRKETAPLMERRAINGALKTIRAATANAQVPDVTLMETVDIAKRNCIVARLAQLEGHITEMCSPPNVKPKEK